MCPISTEFFPTRKSFEESQIKFSQIKLKIPKLMIIKKIVTQGFEINILFNFTQFLKIQITFMRTKNEA